MEDKEIKEFLIDNGLLIKRIAFKTNNYKDNGCILDKEDLIQEGYLIAYRLLKGCNPEKSKPKTYLVNYLPYHLARYKRKTEAALTYSYGYLDHEVMCSKYYEECLKNNIKVIPEEIAKKFNISLKAANNLIHSSKTDNKSNKAMSIDTIYKTKDEPRTEIDLDKGLDNARQIDFIKKKISILSVGERKVIKALLKEAFKKEYCTREMAEKLNMSETNFCTKIYTSAKKFREAYKKYYKLESEE